MLLKEYSSDSAEDTVSSSKEEKKSDDMSRLYENVEVAEKNIEETITEHPYLIEEGMVCLDHKFARDGRINALLLDSGNSLVIAEIKIGDPSDMIDHCLEYYSKVMENISDYARILKGYDDDTEIETTRRPRIFLIAPEFSVEILKKLRWLSIDVSAYQIKCIRPVGSKTILPVFFKVSVPETPEMEEGFKTATAEKAETVVKEKASMSLYFDSPQESPGYARISDESEEDGDYEEESAEERE